MGRYYLLGNVTKSQGMWSSMPLLGIMLNGSFHVNLALLLLNFGQSDQLKQKSLEDICLEYLARYGDKKYAPGYEQQLPKHMQQKLKITKLAQLLHIGAWSGDRLIITGGHTEYNPFPPDGKWKKGNLFSMIRNSFANSPDVLAIYSEENKEALSELTKICEDKLYFVVNLDLKEYLDPRAYPRAYHAGEKNALLFVNWVGLGGVLSDLVMKLIPQSTWGAWAGCRVKICAAEDVEDFESFKDVSNAEDI